VREVSVFAGEISAMPFAASTVGVPVAMLPGYAAFSTAYQAAGLTTRPSDYGPYAYDAANVVINALAKILKGKTSLPKDLRRKLVAAVQKTNTKGLTGTVAFDAYGDAKAPTFTLYRVDGAPLSWTPQP
jgi:ABC-type branched-subunit amino acid transport system substrate-binding protein